MEKLIAITRDEAFSMADEYVPGFAKNMEASKNAGYPIFDSSAAPGCWISDLEDRLEINMPEKTFCIWIEPEKYTVQQVRTIIVGAQVELRAIQKIRESLEGINAAAAVSVEILLFELESKYKVQLEKFGL